MSEPLTQDPVANAAVAKYREKLGAIEAAFNKTIADSGGRRDELPAVPTPEQVAERDAERAERAGKKEEKLGELGIPPRLVRGIGAAWNFTIGPVLIYEGPKTLDAIIKLADPHIIVAEYIPEDELKRMEKTRVRGFVIEKGSLIDPTYWIFQDENRAAVIAAPGARELARNGEMAIVDGVRGVAYFGPDKGTEKDYQYLRWIGCPPRDSLMYEGLRQLSGVLMGNKIRLGEIPPFEFPEQDRLLDVSKRARNGTPITKEDDEWMKAFILVGMPSPEQLMADAKKGGRDLKEPKRDEKPETPPVRGRRSAEPAAAPGAGEPAGSGDATGEGVASSPAARTAAGAAAATPADEREARKAAARAAREAPIGSPIGGPKPMAEPKVTATASAAPVDKTPTVKVEDKKAETPTAKPAAEADKGHEGDKGHASHSASEAKEAALSRKAQREAEIARIQAERDSKHKKEDGK